MSVSPNWQSPIDNRQFLFGLFMSRMLTATSTELAEFQAVRRGLLVLGRHIVPTLTIGTLKHNVIAWHKLFPISDFPISNFQLPIY